jgi:hypothetical protein
VVEPVAISRYVLVTADSADNSVNGSNEVTVWLRFSASTGMFSTGQMVGHEEGVELSGSRVSGSGA